MSAIAQLCYSSYQLYKAACPSVRPSETLNIRMKSTILEPICVSDGEKTARRTIVVSLSGEPSRAERLCVYGRLKVLSSFLDQI